MRSLRQKYKKTAWLNVRISPEDKRIAELIARSNDYSLSDTIICLIHSHRAGERIKATFDAEEVTLEMPDTNNEK